MEELIGMVGMIGTIPALKEPCAYCGEPLGTIHYTYKAQRYCSMACVPRARVGVCPTCGVDRELVAQQNPADRVHVRLFLSDADCAGPKRLFLEAVDRELDGLRHSLLGLWHDRQRQAGGG